MDDVRRCTGTAKSTGKRCERAAIVGGTVCYTHGGNASQVKQAARGRVERERAEAALATLGLPRDVDPHAALLEEVHRTAGHIQWLEHVVRDLERESLVRGVTKQVALPDGGRRVEIAAALNAWVRLYQSERKHLVEVARTAIACGVARRQVELAEHHAQQIARVVTAILTDLGHDLADERTRQVVRLRLIEGGREAA